MIFDSRSGQSQKPWLSSVGTGGCGEEGWGPCACPRAEMIRWHHATQRILGRRRTGTRPPPFLTTSPCPYRMVKSSLPDSVGKIHQDVESPHYPIRLAKFIREAGRIRVW